MISFAEAVEAVTALRTDWGTEQAGLEESAGRILAGVVTADRDYPPFNRAAMDGYAVRSDDVLEKKMTTFRVIGELFAGDASQFAVRSGEAVKIMTGAPVPDDADAVIKREDAVESDGMVTFSAGEFEARQCIAPRGADIASGAAAIARPVQIASGQFSVLASLGQHTVEVYRRPRTALISTGNEILPVEGAVAPYQIRDSNRYSIQGFLHNYAIRPERAMIVRDEMDELTRAIDSVIGHDILIITGGVSAGDADFVPEALQRCGVEKIFHKVKIRPGKPLWVGRHENGARVFALPGNPYSVQAACRLFIDPFIRACFHLAPAAPLALPLAGPRKKRTPFDEFFPAKITNAGGAHVQALTYHSSGDITAALDADGIARHPASAGDLGGGEVVDLYLWKNIR